MKPLILNFNPFPELETSRLILRRLNDGDVSEIFALRSDERVRKFLIRPRATSIEEAAKFIASINDGIEKNEHVMWGLTLKDGSRVVGTICLWQIRASDYRAEIGFEMLHDFQERGFMQESISAVLDYGFKKMDLHSIEGHVNPQNLPSIHLMEKNGFVREALFRENCYFEGEFRDTAVYALLKPNYLKRI